MANRLTKIYTRTGDAGKTGLASGERVAKDAPRIEAMGAVDELNSAIGLMLTETMPDSMRDYFARVQHELFDLGGELSVPGHPLLNIDHISGLERTLEAWNAELSALKDFILPGGSRAAAMAHMARTICRRAERRVVALSHIEAPGEFTVPYLNRLSDLLFVAARRLNQHHAVHDVLWQATLRGDKSE